MLTSLLTELRCYLNSEPGRVAEEASSIYGWLSAKGSAQFFFDEREYFMGEAALLTGSSKRLLGQLQDAEGWLDRADANFRHTVSPAAHLARVAYTRLAIRHDMNRHDDVLELLPSAALTFERLGMGPDLAKCTFLRAMSLRMVGRDEEAAECLESLRADASLELDLRGRASLNLGNLHSARGDFKKAVEFYRDAQACLQGQAPTSARADLKMLFGETLRSMGRLAEAIAAYREAIEDLVTLGMATRVAYFRIALAEALLDADMAREAEWEILAALPTIDDQHMVPEGLAAVALLRESVRQRRTDPSALGTIRQYLQSAS